MLNVKYDSLQGIISDMLMSWYNLEYVSGHFAAVVCFLT